MRKQIVQSLRRSQPLAKVNGGRTFASSARRAAEVELTVDVCVADSDIPLYGLD